MKLNYLMIFGLIVSTSSFMQEGTENFVQSWTKQGKNCFIQESWKKFTSKQTITTNSDDKKWEVNISTIFMGTPTKRGLS